MEDALPSPPRRPLHQSKKHPGLKSSKSTNVKKYIPPESLWVEAYEGIGIPERPGSAFKKYLMESDKDKTKCEYHT